MHFDACGQRLAKTVRSGLGHGGNRYPQLTLRVLFDTPAQNLSSRARHKAN